MLQKCPRIRVAHLRHGFAYVLKLGVVVRPVTMPKHIRGPFGDFSGSPGFF
jgi:hypothetical protein